MQLIHHTVKFCVILCCLIAIFFLGIPQNILAYEQNVAEDVKTLKEDMDEVFQLIGKLEKKSILDKINIGAEVRQRIDWFEYKDHNTREHERVHGLPSTRFRLNLGADVTQDLTFYSRLVMFKNWWDGSYNDDPLTSDLNRSRIRTNSDLKVERAYFNYLFFNNNQIPMALTFGRLPLTDGLPTDLRENTPRKSAYPSLAFETEGDGIALSAGLNNLIHLPNSYLKFIYMRQVTDNNDQIFRQDALKMEDINLYIAQFETQFPGKLQDIIFITNLFYLPDLPSPDLQTVMGWTPLYLPDSLGEFLRFTFFIESKQFLGSWVDWFAGYALTMSNANGKVALYNTGLPAPLSIIPLGLLNLNGKRDHTAYAIHVGTRLNLPLKILNNPKIGIEYNKGSKYLVGSNYASEDPLHKLDTRGYVWDIYYFQPIIKHFSLRAGFTFVHNNYSDSGSYFGQPFRVNQEITNAYCLMEAKF